MKKTELKVKRPNAAQMKKKSADSAVNRMLEKTSKKGLETVWDRSEMQKPRCGFGELGLCCDTCYMGPCRINPREGLAFLISAMSA